MKTYQPKKLEFKERWILIDAEGKILGRLAVKIANMLRGRDTALYTSNVDTGAYIIVINSDKIAVSGKKENQKQYFRYSGYMGGLKSSSLEKVRAKDSTRIIKNAVKNMLPDNILARQIYKKLFVYKDANHPHEAQKAQKMEL